MAAGGTATRHLRVLGKEMQDVHGAAAAAATTRQLEIELVHPCPTLRCCKRSTPACATGRAHRRSLVSRSARKFSRCRRRQSNCCLLSPPSPVAAVGDPPRARPSHPISRACQCSKTFRAVVLQCGFSSGAGQVRRCRGADHSSGRPMPSPSSIEMGSALFMTRFADCMAPTATDRLRTAR